MPLIDVDAAAERLNVTPRFVRRLVTERRVPYFKVGKFIRFDTAELEQWLADCRVDPRISKGDQRPVTSDLVATPSRHDVWTDS